MELISEGKYTCHCWHMILILQRDKGRAAGGTDQKKKAVADNCIHNVESCWEFCKCSFSVVYALKPFFSLILQPTENSTEDAGCF